MPAPKMSVFFHTTHCGNFTISRAMDLIDVNPQQHLHHTDTTIAPIQSIMAAELQRVGDTPRRCHLKKEIHHTQVKLHTSPF